MPEVVVLLEQAAAWAAARGTSAWTAEHLRPHIFEAAAAAGEVFAWIEDGKLVAVMLLQRSDPVHWPEDRPGEALYVHKLAADRRAAGRGLGAALIAFAERRAHEAGITSLRLDTLPDTKLAAYYEGLGFVADPRGPAVFAGRRLIRMQKRLGDQP